RIDKVRFRLIHENHMIRRPQLTPVRRQHAGLAISILCGVLCPMPLRSIRSDRRLGRDSACAHGWLSFPPAGSYLLSAACAAGPLRSDFTTTFYLMRQLTSGLISHIEKVSLALRDYTCCFTAISPPAGAPVPP